MNLLTDDWLPVLDAGRFRQISLQELLCTDGDFRLALPRDDMELSGLALAIALTQTLFLPADVVQWRQRIKTPLTTEEYAAGIEPYRDWFDLDHATRPFMQFRGVKAEKITRIQKLFAGLPEGEKSHTFFNPDGEIKTVCSGCAAIALFHQASTCPGFGGGFKDPLRAAASVTTFVDMSDFSPGCLRRRIWRNVLPMEKVICMLPGAPSGQNDIPVWILPIVARSTVHASSIGLRRGLFWQPAHVELNLAAIGHCDHCGATDVSCYSGFLKEQFDYKIDGLWPHPHSPKQWVVKQGQRKEYFLTFNTTAPAWTQLTQYVFRQEAARKGAVPAAVVMAWGVAGDGIGKTLNLLIGGYRNKKANIVERRHELFSFTPGWEGSQIQMEAIVSLALEVRSILFKSLKLAVKGRKNLYFDKSTSTDSINHLHNHVTIKMSPFKGIKIAIHEVGDNSFFARSGTLVLAELHEIDWINEDWNARFDVYRAALITLAKEIFTEVVAPYRNDPELIHAVSAARRKLVQELQPLLPPKEQETTQS